MRFAAKTVHGPTYHDLWNGLRVRIGIHFGRGDITYDTVTKGYDYYAQGDKNTYECIHF